MLPSADQLFKDADFIFQQDRYPLKPRIFASLLETKGYQNTLRPDHPESIFGLNNLFKSMTVLFYLHIYLQPSS